MTYEEELLNKIDSGEELTERELQTLIWECYEVDRDYGENGRWTRGVTSVIELCGRYFEVYWEEGLTEYQENEYYDQPVEVEKKEYDKTIHVVEWVKKEK